MKPGLLLKEAPEPIHIFKCWNWENHKPCNAVFFDSYDYQQHRKLVHGEIYTLKKEIYNHNGFEEIYYHATWLKIEESDGMMILPFNANQTRPTQRFNVTKEEMANLAKGNCHCGKPKHQFQKGRRKYCSDKCAESWYFRKCYVGDHRNQFLHKHGTKCENCSHVAKSCYDLEMDHIIAIALGGHPWDERNLQALCEQCHKEKTKQDVALIAFWRRDSNYDASSETEMIEIDRFQQKLECFI